MNRFTKWVNHFRPLNDKTGKVKMTWRLMRVKWYLSQFRLPRMNVDTIQNSLNRFRISQRHIVIRLIFLRRLKNESIHTCPESINTKSETFVIRLRYAWIDSCRRNIDFDRWYVVIRNFLETHVSLGALTHSKIQLARGFITPFHIKSNTLSKLLKFEEKTLIPARVKIN